MTKFFNFKTDKLDLTAQAKTVEDARKLLLAASLARIVKKDPYIKLEHFDMLRDMTRKALWNSKVTEINQ